METEKTKPIDLNVRVIDLTIGELILAIIPSQKQDNNSLIEEDEIGGIELAMRITGKSKSTIYGMTSKNKIPFMKTPGSKSLYFSKNDLIKWLRSNNKETDYDIANQASDDIYKRKAFRIR